MFVFRPLSSGTSASDVGKRMSKESVAAVKQKFKGTTMQQVRAAAPISCECPQSESFVLGRLYF